jgi:hypothetical protein
MAGSATGPFRFIGLILTGILFFSGLLANWLGWFWLREGRKSRVMARFGIWQSSLFCADAGDVELELRPRTKYGGGFRGRGRFA